MTKETFQVIEINGVKLEVDMRYAKRIEELRIGSRVKVLLSPDYGDVKVHPGIVVGFEPFATLPTIIIAYVAQDYNDVGLKTISYNAKSKNVEIVASVDEDFSVSKDEVLGWFRRERQKLSDKIAEIDAKEQFFLDRFKGYWRDEPLADQLAKDGLNEPA
jgi:hypothetical protein